MFKKILIANRGEIARRVIRTAKRMRIATVAVFSEADAKAMHVADADEAVAIGPAPARESYLRIDRIIDAAKRTGAEAIHPGYGFLSENPLFAEACEAAGVVFVGPPAAAMRAMGSKADAKRLMAAAGVPLVPGYHGEDQSEALLAAKAAMIGFPVLIKASAGGGGRGMRAVDRTEDFSAQLAAARREAEAAFGDGRVLLEKYLQRPRHIEVQLLGDHHGNLLHLGTRDCSIQRRHQKIVEEAPAPGLSDAARERIHQAALAAGRAVNYCNAGTVEFIAEGAGPDPSFFFMEMNTRLQVEHPVTEAIFGIDLVEQQLRIAAGEKLRLLQSDLRAEGHAIEVRLCAEDPSEDFRPTTGVVVLHQPGPLRPGARIDVGYRTGDRASQHYDNLLAKVIASDESREAARAHLRALLAGFEVPSPGTNLKLLQRIVAHDAFAAAELDTGFLDRHRAELLPAVLPPPLHAWAAAAFLEAGRNASPARGQYFSLYWSPSDDPWRTLLGFRLQGAGSVRVALRCSGETRRFDVRVSASSCWIDRGGAGPLVCVGDWQDVRAVEVDGVGSAVNAEWAAGTVVVGFPGQAESYEFHPLDPYAPPETAAAAADRIAAPIPGAVIRVDVAEGDLVKRGQVLLVMEAMKTEIRITAPADGVVAKVLIAPGAQVQEGFELVVLKQEIKE